VYVYIIDEIQKIMIYAFFEESPTRLVNRQIVLKALKHKKTPIGQMCLEVTLMLLCSTLWRNLLDFLCEDIR
jgi:hypothetical protein